MMTIGTVIGLTIVGVFGFIGLPMILTEMTPVGMYKAFRGREIRKIEKRYLKMKEPVPSIIPHLLRELLHLRFKQLSRKARYKAVYYAHEIDIITLLENLSQSALSDDQKKKYFKKLDEIIRHRINSYKIQDESIMHEIDSIYEVQISNNVK